MFGEQAWNIVQVLGGAQSAAVVTVQEASGAQQEPSGCGQVCGAQAPDRVQEPVQADWIMTMQLPSVAQQEPVGWSQVFGAQRPPSVQEALQFASVVTVQVPAGAQHAPVGVGASVGLSSFPHAANTIANIAATVACLRMATPPSNHRTERRIPSSLYAQPRMILAAPGDNRKVLLLRVDLDAR
jgi:hypothetical protein